MHTNKQIKSEISRNNNNNKINYLEEIHSLYIFYFIFYLVNIFANWSVFSISKNTVKTKKRREEEVFFQIRTISGLGLRELVFSFYLLVSRIYIAI